MVIKCSVVFGGRSGGWVGFWIRMLVELDWFGVGG